MSAANTTHEPYYYYTRLREHIKGMRSTTVGFAENELSLKYHDTVVARYYFDTQTLILEHNGYRTSTTKNRINGFCGVLGLPAGVYQHKKRFHIHHRPSGVLFGPDRVTIDWGHVDECDDDEISIEGIRP